MIGALIVTIHAQKRWEYRFADFDLETELEGAKPINKPKVQKLYQVSRHKSGTRYLLARESRALFVVVDDHVLTALHPLKTATKVASVEKIRRYKQSRPRR